MVNVVCSKAMEDYFNMLAEETDRCYSIARKARARGLDPETYVEIPRADDLASRVEKLLEPWHVEGVAERIRELSKDHNREEVSLLVAKEMASRPSKSREEAIDRAIRVGLAVLTEGILVAPLEGIAGVKVGQNGDGSEYLAISFAGPIRAAGGTGQALSVLIADVVRRELGIGRYIPTDGEVQRLKEEIPLYKQCQHLQYSPTNDEIEIIVRNCPVCIDGEGTEDQEISGFRDLPRIETNKVRGGACLVISEGMTLKAPKIQKHTKKLGIDGWEFIDEYLEWKKRHEAKGGEKEEGGKVGPDSKYLKDMVAGRPVIGHPSTPGGLRLRYGRGRTAGLAALAINPATMVALDDFLAIGTQIKIERPGKAGAVTPCDTIEGPILLLKNGDLVQANTVREAKAVKDSIAEIIDLGEVLLPYGEFMENNHVLVPGAFSPEWYRVELESKGPLPDDWERPSWERAKEISRQFGVPLHPLYNLFWYDIPLEDLQALRTHVLNTGKYEGDHLTLAKEKGAKRTLELLGALHRMEKGRVRIDHYALPLIEGLGLPHRRRFHNGGGPAAGPRRPGHGGPRPVQLPFPSSGVGGHGHRGARPRGGADRGQDGAAGEGQGEEDEAPAPCPLPAGNGGRDAASGLHRHGVRPVVGRDGRPSVHGMREEHLHVLLPRVRRAHAPVQPPGRAEGGPRPHDGGRHVKARTEGVPAGDQGRPGHDVEEQDARGPGEGDPPRPPRDLRVQGRHDPI